MNHRLTEVDGVLGADHDVAQLARSRADAVAIDGGCFAMPWLKDGTISATTQQYPLLMAADGVEQIADFLKNGTKPHSIDSGEKLITDQPMPGVPSISVEEGLKLCWG